MTASIRFGRVGDLPAIVDIYNYFVLNSVATFDLQPKKVEDRQAWFDIHCGNSRFPLWIAEITDETTQQQKMVGWATFSEWSDRPAYSATGELSIYVHHEHQRSGIGGKLMQLILEHAKEHRFHAVIGRVSETNDKSVAMHLKFGFFHVGRLREVGFKFGKWLGVDIFQKLIPLDTEDVN